jgi:N-acetylated-alpha-linked acidic dipeptidase
LQILQPDNPFEGKQIRLVNNVDTKVMPIWNVIGVIPGYIKDEVVLTGNHRDGKLLTFLPYPSFMLPLLAWVFGAVDPNSGTASVHEVIRGFGHLMKNGWKPLRTIVIASWDAEEVMPFPSESSTLMIRASTASLEVPNGVKISRIGLIRTSLHTSI